MRIVKELLTGLIFSILSIVFFLGAASLSIVEGKMTEAQLSAFQATAPQVQTPVTIPSPTPTRINQITPLPSPTFTSLPSPTPCPIPEGWVSYIVQQGDTINTLAELHQVEWEIVFSGNCLLSQELIPGTLLYLPPAPVVEETPIPTLTPVLCGPPTGWVPYTIKANDTLYLLSVYFGVSIYELQLANCMGTSTLIRTGDILYVPRYPVFLPTETLTPIPSLTATSTVIIPTDTPQSIYTTESPPLETETVETSPVIPTTP